MIVQTWLVNPLWQETFPFGLTTAGSEEFNPVAAPKHSDGCPGFFGADISAAPARSEGTTSAGRERVEPPLLPFRHPAGCAEHQRRSGKRGLGMSPAAMSQRRPPRTSTDRAPFLGLELFPVTITNVAPEPHFRDMYERSGLFRRSGIYRIAYWAWELDEIPAEWVKFAPASSTKSGRRLRLCDRRFSANACPFRFTKMLPGLQLGEITPVTRSGLGVPEEKYVFLFMFDMSSQMERKNPLAVIRAFQAAFPDATGRNPGPENKSRRDQARSVGDDSRGQRRTTAWL